jgi:Protein of unknown function (DUF1353)
MFVTKLILSDFNPNEWVLESALVWHDRVKRIEVPRGFITDLASIPRGLRAVLNVNGRSRKAAVLHDYLYCEHKLNRSKCDALFLSALVAEGMNSALARTYWLGVRAGGWLYYNKRTGLTIEDFVNV